MSSHLLDNSLTSISSLQTLPPSPRHVTTPASQPHNGRPPTHRKPDGLGVTIPGPHLTGASPAPGELAGSVPSPRPRMSSAPAPARPRLLRVPSSPTSSAVQVSSPLNPACRKQTGEDRMCPTHFFSGSVPQPRPPRLFSSSLSSPSEPDLVPKHDQASPSGATPVLHRPRAPSRARPIVVPDMALLTHHPVPHTAPVPITALSPREPSEHETLDGEEDGRAPSSFSEFVQTVLAPRHDRLLSFDQDRGDVQDTESLSTQIALSRSPDIARKLAWVN